jgi:erythromycin esterase
MRRYFTKQASLEEGEVTASIRQWAYPLKSKAGLDPLFEKIGDARIVMLGEASHGTHEYYTWRTHITKRLAEEKGFNFVAVEGDWPDC